MHVSTECLSVPMSTAPQQSRSQRAPSSRKRRKVKACNGKTGSITAGATESGKTEGLEKSVTSRPVEPDSAGPWLRRQQLGTVFMPVPDNLAGKTCGISAGQALLTAMLSDRYLGELQTRACPPAILAPFADSGPIKAAWSRLRDSVCRYQTALRNPSPSSQAVLPTGLLQELIEASYVYGTLSNDHRIEQVLPFGLSVTDARLSGFLTRALLDQICESDSEEYLSFLLDALGVSLTDHPWSNYLEMEQSEIYHLGAGIRLSKPFRPMGAGPWLDVCFASGPGEYRPRGLQEYLVLRAVNSEGEQVTLDADDEQQVIQILTAQQTEVEKSEGSAEQKKATIRRLEALKAKDWQRARVPHTSLARFTIDDRNDGVCLRFKVGRKAGEPPAGSFDNNALMLAPAPPADLNLVPYAPQASLKEHYCYQGRSVQGAPTRYYISQAMPQEQGVRCRLSQALYDMFAIPVAQLTPIRRPNEKGDLSLNINGRLMQAMEVLPHPASYARAQVREAIATGGDIHGAVVVDALVGHRDVGESRLAVQRQPRQPFAALVPTIYRTDFSGCMGYSRAKGWVEGRYGNSAVEDLNRLKIAMNASDESICTGMALLSQLTDHDIHHLVHGHGGAYLPGATLNRMAEQLKNRRDSLLKLAQYQPSQEQQRRAGKIALSCRNKSHQEVVTALAMGDGCFELPEVYRLGQRESYQAQISAVLCQLGQSSQRNGHIISLLENSGEWFVADDLRNRAGALPLSHYLRVCHNEHLIDPQGPNRWSTLISMLTKDRRLVTPLLLYGRRLNVQPRPEQDWSFVQRRLTSWLNSVELEQAARKEREKLADDVLITWSSDESSSGLDSESESAPEPKSKQALLDDEVILFSDSD